MDETLAVVGAVMFSGLVGAYAGLYVARRELRAHTAGMLHRLPELDWPNDIDIPI